MDCPSRTPQALCVYPGEEEKFYRINCIDRHEYIYIYIFFFQEKISDLYKKLSKIVFVLIYGLYGLLAKEWVRKQKAKRY